MSGIVCAVRGGPASKSTIDRSIELAKESGLALYFIYVVNLDFLEYAIHSTVQTISQQMENMGEFILLAAQATANSKGIKAQTFVRHGNVPKEISRLCHEIQANYLVLGRPNIQREDSLFTEKRLAEFIQGVEEQTGATVVLPEPGES